MILVMIVVNVEREKGDAVASKVVVCVTSFELLISRALWNHAIATATMQPSGDRPLNPYVWRLLRNRLRPYSLDLLAYRYIPKCTDISQIHDGKVRGKEMYSSYLKMINLHGQFT
eukprot:SAG31_NODE_5432_length_2542_cov_2.314777_2_plen_115_part_00